MDKRITFGLKKLYLPLFKYVIRSSSIRWVVDVGVSKIYLNPDGFVSLVERKSLNLGITFLVKQRLLFGDF